MTIQEHKVGDCVVLALAGRLVLGGPAEEYEQRAQLLLTQGVQHLITDLQEVTNIDSTGIRSVIRGYTTAHRLGVGFRLAGLKPIVRTVMQVTHLDTIVPMYETVEAALSGGAEGAAAAS